ncbi:MAG TPA: dipeptidase, partial [Aggregatilineales bacterium]|nr:dipeptidase [Aggregatilineales bacterium]
EWLEAGDNMPTVLVYGHYDVQPIDPIELWQSDPFEPQERSGNLYARGATDDKGQMMIHLKTFETFMKSRGSFPVNLKVILEGEEENASPNLEPFIKQHTDLLACDVVVLSDMEVLNENQPTITYGVRGMMYMEVEVWGPKEDLHSGSFGGTVHNPVQALVEILAQLHDENRHVTIPGFYDDVVELTPQEREALAKLPLTDDWYLEHAGVSKLWGEPGFTANERIGARPTLELNGIVGGWTKEGQKTVIGASALAKVSTRLVPNQDPLRIYKMVKDHIAKLTPDTVRSEVRNLGPGAFATLVPLESKEIQIAADAYEKTFGNRPLFVRSGGTLPIVGLCQKILNAPVLLMGFGLPDDNLHAPNEKFTLSMFHKGIQTMLHFYDSLPESR